MVSKTHLKSLVKYSDRRQSTFLWTLTARPCSRTVRSEGFASSKKALHRSESKGLFFWGSAMVDLDIGGCWLSLGVACRLVLKIGCGQMEFSDCFRKEGKGSYGFMRAAQIVQSRPAAPASSLQSHVKDGAEDLCTIWNRMSGSGVMVNITLIKVNYHSV